MSANFKVCIMSLYIDSYKYLSKLLSVCVLVCLSVSVRMSIYSSISRYHSLCLRICLSFCLSICIAEFMSACMSIWMSLDLSINLSDNLSFLIFNPLPFHLFQRFWFVLCFSKYFCGCFPIPRSWLERTQRGRKREIISNDIYFVEMIIFEIGVEVIASFLSSLSCFCVLSFHHFNDRWTLQTNKGEK